MDSDQESMMKEEVGRVLKDNSVNGYLLLYLEGDKIQMTGSLPLSALAPHIMKAVTSKLGGLGGFGGL